MKNDKNTPEILPSAAVAEMLARAEAATPGEWATNGRSPAAGSHCVDLRINKRIWRSTREYSFHMPKHDEDDHQEPCCDCGEGQKQYAQEIADLRFIAAARHDLPALCVSHEALRVFGVEQVAEIATTLNNLRRAEKHIEVLEAGLRDLVETSDLVFSGEAPEGTSDWRAFGLALNRASALLSEATPTPDAVECPTYSVPRPLRYTVEPTPDAEKEG